MQVKMSIVFCQLIIFYKGHLSSGTHEFPLPLDLQHLGFFGKDPVVGSSAFLEASHKEDTVG